MESLKNNPYIALVFRLIVGFVFVMYAVDKIANPSQFAISISKYQILPTPVINLFALILPWIELLCGLMMILGVRLRASSLAISGMLVMFIFALLNVIARNIPDVSCGCSGTPEPVGFKKIAEDTFYLIASLYVFFYPNTWATLEQFVSNAESAQQTPTLHGDAIA